MAEDRVDCNFEKDFVEGMASNTRRKDRNARLEKSQSWSISSRPRMRVDITELGKLSPFQTRSGLTDALPCDSSARIIWQPDDSEEVVSPRRVVLSQRGLL